MKAQYLNSDGHCTWMCMDTLNSSQVRNFTCKLMKCFMLSVTFSLVVEACNIFDRCLTILCGSGVALMIPCRDLWLVNKRLQGHWIGNFLSLSLLLSHSFALTLSLSLCASFFITIFLSCSAAINVIAWGYVTGCCLP